MNTYRFLAPILLFALILSACSSALEPIDTVAPSAQPATNTSLPSETPLPTNTLEPTATPTIAPSATPTFVFPTPQFMAELLEPGNTTDGSTSPFAKLYYFKGYKGVFVSIQVDTNEYSFPFTIKNESNKGLIGSEAFNRRVSTIESYQLPYTGIYYILVDRIPHTRWGGSTACKSKNPPAYCMVGGPFTITITIQ